MKKKLLIGFAVVVVLFAMFGEKDESTDAPTDQTQDEVVTQDEPKEEVKEPAKEEEKDDTSLDTISTDLAVSSFKQVVLETFPDAIIDIDEAKGILTMSVIQDDLASAATVALINSEMREKWNGLVDNMVYSNGALTDLVQDLDPSLSVVFNVLNDKNADLVLITVMNGNCIYDAVRDSK